MMRRKKIMLGEYFVPLAGLGQSTQAVEGNRSPRKRVEDTAVSPCPSSTL